MKIINESSLTITMKHTQDIDQKNHLAYKNTDNSKRKINYSIENFRAIAILFVILSHLDLSTLGAWKIHASFILGDATTFFVFISGFLFYHLSFENFHFKSYILKKIKFVATPYLLISIITISVGLHLKHNEHFNLDPIAYIAWSLWIGGAINHPMWFIPMIWFFFISAPIIIKIAKSDFLPIALIASLAFSLFSSRPLLNTNPILSTLHFLGFYILGIFFAKNSNLCQWLKAHSKTMIPFFLLLAALSFLAYLNQKTDPEVGFYAGIFQKNFIQFGKLFILLSIYLITTNHLNKKNNKLSYIADISFGLFFLHALWKIIADRIIAFFSINTPAFILLIELTFMIIGSLACIMLLRKAIKARSRYVIGC